MKSSSSFVVVAASLIGVAVGSLSHAAAPLPAAKAGVALDYEFFKSKVQPVFLTRRDGHTRCYVCHSNNNARFHLVTLSPGAATWNDAQSKQNFELIKRVAVPGSIDSPIVMHPLDEKAGGHPHHGGGQQFESQSDPAWQTLKAFVMGEKAVASR